MKTKNILLIILVMAILFTLYVLNMNTYENKKYKFTFSYGNLIQLEKEGNIFTCGKYACATFSGSPGFDYNAYELSLDMNGFEDGYLYMKDELIQGKSYRFLYFLDDDVVYKTYNIHPAEPYSDEEYEWSQKRSKVTPYYINKHGVEFYVTGFEYSPEYCTYHSIDKNKVTRVCFGIDETSQNMPKDEKVAGLPGSLQKVFETFKFRRF